MNLTGLDISILGPACLAGLIVLATHVPLGQQVLKRGIIFIDLAIAQVAALGVIGAQFFEVDQSGIVVQFAAAGATLVGAGLLSFTDRRWPRLQEPLIGTLFVLAATGALLLLAHNPHGGEHLKDLMVGQILWVSFTQLIPSALVSAALLALLWWRHGRLSGIAFYAVFALAITVSVQLVGVYLVFASLIVPALATSTLHAGRLLAVQLRVVLQSRECPPLRPATAGSRDPAADEPRSGPGPGRCCSPPSSWRRGCDGRRSGPARRPTTALR